MMSEKNLFERFKELVRGGRFSEAESMLLDKFPDGLGSAKIESLIQGLYVSLNKLDRASLWKAKYYEREKLELQASSLNFESSLLKTEAEEHEDLTIDEEMPFISSLRKFDAKETSNSSTQLETAQSATEQDPVETIKHSKQTQHVSSFNFVSKSVSDENEVDVISDWDDESPLDDYEVDSDEDEVYLPEDKEAGREESKPRVATYEDDLDDSYEDDEEFVDDIDEDEYALIKRGFSTVETQGSLITRVNGCFPATNDACTQLSELEKSRQKAAELIYEYDLSREYLNPVTSILLVKHCHWRTIKELRKLFDIEVSVTELVLALDIRGHWEYDGYSYSDGLKADAGAGPKAQISWMYSVLLLRMLKTDDLDDAMNFVSNKNSEWRTNNSIRSTWPNFYSYIRFIIDSYHHNVFLKGESLPIFDVLIEEEYEFDPAIGSEYWNKLAELGILTSQPNERSR